MRGRSVECGACDHRFRIEGEALVRGPKVYPGERGTGLVNQFQRVPLSAVSLPGGLGVSYASPPDPVALEPVSPQRVIAGAVGVVGMVLMALLLMLSTGRGGALDGMTTGNRLVMAGFTGLMGLAALVYANPLARMKAFMIGVALSACLISVPFFFTEGSVPLEKLTAQGDLKSSEGWTLPPAEVEADGLAARIGTQPLLREIERLSVEKNGTIAAGIWLRGLSNNHKYLVRDYLLRVTHADPASHAYPRDGGNYLFVLTGIRLSLQELAQLAAPLGEIDHVYPEISVIEVKVNVASFIEGPIEKLKNKDHPEFYELNKRELESVDLERAKRAVQRLAEAEPKVFRSDITRKLLALLSEESVTYKADICTALEVWSEKPGPAGQAALLEIGKLMKRNVPIPKPIVALAVKEKIPEAVPVLDELWRGDAATWESLYADLGTMIEPTVIRHFPDVSGNLRHSAIRILGRVGGAESLMLMESITPGADSELRVLIEQAGKSIAGRMNP